MEDTKNTTNEQQAQQNATPADNGGDQGRMFTQDEVNKIVSDRLARERAKGEPSPQELKEKELSARENRIAAANISSKQESPTNCLTYFPRIMWTLSRHPVISWERRSRRCLGSPLA